MRNLVPHFVHQQFTWGNMSGRSEAAVLFVNRSGLVFLIRKPHCILQPRVAQIAHGPSHRAFMENVPVRWKTWVKLGLFDGVR